MFGLCNKKLCISCISLIGIKGPIYLKNVLICYCRKGSIDPYLISLSSIVTQSNSPWPTQKVLNSLYVCCRAIDWGYKWWFVAASNTGMVTNTEDWRCTNKSESNWNQEGFDDSHWPHAVQVGFMPEHPLGCNAKRIWHETHEYTKNIWCRYTGKIV